MINNIFNNSLITGGTSIIGKNIHFGYKPTSKEMDITSIESITTYINSLTTNISCIIHLAAYNLRDCEQNKNKAINININGTINMIHISIKYNIPFVLISTGAVFSTLNPDESFDENNIVCPNCTYGYTKESAEKIALLYNKSIIIRTGWLFGGSGNNYYNFIENYINNLNKNKIITCSNNFYGSPTYVIDLIEQIKYLIFLNHPSHLKQLKKYGKTSYIKSYDKRELFF
jgi:dTDP-4-dehydrorhamnose reductase